MEEKKNNKGIIIIFIVFLTVCLIAIFYFMFKMVYVETNNNTQVPSDNSEQTPIDNTNVETSTGVFTELTKYELQEGEEKEITIDGKTIKIKREGVDSIIINENKLQSGYSNKFYTTNNFLIFCQHGQYGEHYSFYDLDGNDITLIKEESDKQYDNIRIFNNRLLIDDAFIINGEKFITLDNLIVTKCLNEQSKDIKSYPNVYQGHYDDSLEKNLTYEIKYINNTITIEKAVDINTIGKWIDSFEKVCVIESVQPNN